VTESLRIVHAKHCITADKDTPPVAKESKKVTEIFEIREHVNFEQRITKDERETHGRETENEQKSK
jgi:hypothetical protein